jgi:hypothetical protein
MRLAFITALQELLPEEPRLVDIICRNIFDDAQDNNNLGLLFGYKNRSTKTRHRFLRAVHMRPVGFDLLLSNISKAISVMRKRKANYLCKKECMLWLDDPDLDLIESKTKRTITNKVMVATEKDTALIFLAAPDEEDEEPEQLDKCRSKVSGILKRRRNIEVVSNCNTLSQIKDKLLTENGEGEDGHKTIEHPDTKQSNRTTSYKGIPHHCLKRH